MSSQSMNQILNKFIDKITKEQIRYSETIKVPSFTLPVCTSHCFHGVSNIHALHVICYYSTDTETF